MAGVLPGSCATRLRIARARSQPRSGRRHRAHRTGAGAVPHTAQPAVPVAGCERGRAALARSRFASRRRTARHGGQRIGAGRHSGVRTGFLGPRGQPQRIGAAAIPRDGRGATRVPPVADLQRRQHVLRDPSSEEGIVLAESSLRSRSETLELARIRMEAGVTSSIDFNQAYALVAQAQTQLAQLHRSRELAQHRLQVLVGVPVPDPLPQGMRIEAASRWQPLSRACLRNCWRTVPTSVLPRSACARRTRTSARRVPSTCRPSR